MAGISFPFFPIQGWEDVEIAPGQVHGTIYEIRYHNNTMSLWYWQAMRSVASNLALMKMHADDPLNSKFKLTWACADNILNALGVRRDTVDLAYQLEFPYNYRRPLDAQTHMKLLEFAKSTPQERIGGWVEIASETLSALGGGQDYDPSVPRRVEWNYYVAVHQPGSAYNNMYAGMMIRFIGERGEIVEHRNIMTNPISYVMNVLYPDKYPRPRGIELSMNLHAFAARFILKKHGEAIDGFFAQPYKGMYQKFYEKGLVTKPPNDKILTYSVELNKEAYKHMSTVANCIHCNQYASSVCTCCGKRFCGIPCQSAEH